MRTSYKAHLHRAKLEAKVWMDLNGPENGTSEQEVFSLSWGAQGDPLCLRHINVSLENLIVNSGQFNQILLQ